MQREGSSLHPLVKTSEEAWYLEESKRNMVFFAPQIICHIRNRKPLEKKQGFSEVVGKDMLGKRTGKMANGAIFISNKIESQEDSIYPDKVEGPELGTRTDDNPE